MKWNTYWWGVEFIAEDRNDQILLEDMDDALPKKATNAYETGTRSIQHTSFKGEKGFTLILDR